MTMATTRRPDTAVRHDVIEELQWDPSIQPTQIGVTVADAMVTLTGSVDTLTMRWAAERAAQRVRGAGLVVNNIEVALPGGAEYTDDEIAIMVERALAWDTSIPSGNIEVIVTRGLVTLRGHVPWQYQKNTAERIVSGLTGVRAVNNEVEVRPHTVPSAEEMKRRIGDALVRNAETAAGRIAVDVRDARVVLHGTVRTWAEKREAERVAWSAVGVCSVENHIMVSFDREVDPNP